MKILDLDVVAGDDTEVKVGDKTYLIPYDVPTPVLLGIVRALEAFTEVEGFEAEMRMLEDLNSKVLALFQIREPNLKNINLGLSQITKLATAIYSGYGFEETVEEATPEQKKTGAAGTKSTSRKKKTA